ncbi:MAG: hypothetical protein IKM33_01580 [Clostridia bacterium]|nr:hypothetical protein [Clostridia bacterium]
MNYLDIDKALVDVTRSKCNECKARLDAIPKDRAAERKALLIENGMYALCGNAGLLFNTGGSREVLYQKNETKLLGLYSPPIPQAPRDIRFLERRRQAPFHGRMAG